MQRRHGITWIIVAGLIMIALANMTDLVAWATTGNTSPVGQTVPTKTPAGQPATPKPPKGTPLPVKTPTPIVTASTHPPALLPISGGSPIDLGGLIFMLGGAGLVAARLMKRKPD